MLKKLRQEILSKTEFEIWETEDYSLTLSLDTEEVPITIENYNEEKENFDIFYKGRLYAGDENISETLDTLNRLIKVVKANIEAGII